MGDWQAYHKHSGTACTHVDDFKERAGALAVTKRVMVGVDYVLEPGKELALEVTAPKYPGTLSMFTDRIMVIDCEGVCGISGPTKAASVDTMANPPASWGSTAEVLHFPGVEFESGGT